MSARMTNHNRLALATCLIALLALSGCPPIAYLVAKIHGPEKVDAEIILPTKKRTLVLVDSPGSREKLKRLLTMAINKELISRDLVDKVVPYDEIVALRLANPRYNRMGASEVGKKLKAETVIHVHVTTFALKDNPQDVMWHGRIEVRVKVVAIPLKRLWPLDRPAGFPVGPLLTDETIDLSQTYATKLTAILAIKMADSVGKLFYKHERTGIEKWGKRPTGKPTRPQ